ncbi:hypothetical protein [Mycolicibacterium diernhoferi]|uniref:Secreted protein n=1 Tax=Mycolicibacterium diernhoferi TaxID=1801 RepID=A0A1Q4HD83_9MYCO|nr:hypothetical protein [Mycolicibacterium diernhoferi]OJZ65468.1 hypothetical protein BRW64_13025 [Mycolicibacterium diernhoferi]OPE45910.1 hypothetical protein BV510_27240 [Mycolicibacterium diernhoferi]PEG52872.1 hypothetical protein CRI78_18820 [Mycolicibacterium diernhoferi]QYL22205.1 hypothetical protein K0O62_25150 [Mycolicibacterium diernhoferi]
MTRLAALLLTVTALATAAPVYADPTVPQQDSSCTADLDGAATMPPGRNLPLVCRGGRWQQTTAPGDPSDRWVGFGPAMALHGDGLRNPNLESGSWTATPLDPDTTCAATQQTVVSAGVLGSPVAAEGAPGQRLSLQVLPSLFDISMTGHCLWERAGD